MDDSMKDSELENYLDALNDFMKKPSKSIPDLLEQLMLKIARHGEPLFPWFKLKPLIVMKLENVIEEYIEFNPHEEVPVLPNVENVRFDDMRERLLKALESFNSAPFTIQRLCELLTEPKRYYRRSDKFMRGIEKNVQVVSTVTPSGKRITSLFELQKSPPMVNGVAPDSKSGDNGFARPDSDGFNSPGSSSRVDSLNGVNHPFCSVSMDAPLQFSYPLSQNTSLPVTSLPQNDIRTDFTKINGLQDCHGAEATSGTEVDVSPGLAESEKMRTSQEPLSKEHLMDNETINVVSSSDEKSCVEDQKKTGGQENKNVDVASSEDLIQKRDNEVVQKEEEAEINISTSYSSNTSDQECNKQEGEKAVHCDGQVSGSGDSGITDEGKELSANAVAASSDSPAPKDEKEMLKKAECPHSDQDLEKKLQVDTGSAHDVEPADCSDNIKATHAVPMMEVTEDAKVKSPNEGDVSDTSMGENAGTLLADERANTEQSTEDKPSANDAATTLTGGKSESIFQADPMKERDEATSSMLGEEHSTEAESTGKMS